MDKLREAFFELVKEITENLAGAFNIGLNTANQYNDRLDFLLVYIMLGFNANYSLREYSMYEAIYNNYIRQLAEQEKKLDLNEDEVSVAEKKNVVNEGEALKNVINEGDALAENQEAPDEVEGVVLASLDESQSAEAIVLSQVISVVTSLSIAALGGGSSSAIATPNSEEPFTPPTLPPAQPTNALDQVVQTLQSMINNAGIQEDDTSVSLNFFDIAESLGFDPSSQEFMDAFNSLFEGGDTLMPMVCMLVGFTMYRVDQPGMGLNAGDTIFTPQATTQLLAEMEIGTENYTFSIPSIGVTVKATVKVVGHNDAPIPPAPIDFMVDDNAANEEILFADILGGTTDPDTGAALMVTGVIVNGVRIPVGGASMGVTVTPTGITFSPEFFNSKRPGDASEIINTEILVFDGFVEVPFKAKFIVQGANDLPTATDGAVDQVDPDPTTDLNSTTYLFSVADFGASDADNDPLSIVFDSLPAVGTLLYGGMLVMTGINNRILLDSLNITSLVHTSIASLNGDTSFLFRIFDGTVLTDQRTMMITVHNDLPNVSWLSNTEFPKFLVGDELFDDPVSNSDLPFRQGFGALADQVDLQHYISDAEGGLVFTYLSPLPSWIAVGDRGTATGSVLNDIGSRPMLDLLNNFSSPLNPTTRTTVTFMVQDNLGEELMGSFEIINFRFDFDILSGLNNADPDLAPATGQTITKDYFLSSAPDDDTQAGSIFILNILDNSLGALADLVEWDIVGGLYHIDVNGGNTALFAADALPMPTGTQGATVRIRIGNDDPSVTVPYLVLLGSNSSDTDVMGVSLMGMMEYQSLFGLGGDDLILGDVSGDTPLVLNDQFLDGGDGNDRIYGDTDGNLLVGAIGGDDFIKGRAGEDILVGDAQHSSGIAGADQIYGGDDHDQIYGDVMGDILEGFAGSDPMLNGDDGDDLIVGDAGGIISNLAGSGSDTINGGPGDDTLIGDSLGDLEGEGAQDFINGDAGQDIIAGETMGDLFPGSTAGDDEIDGGTEDDIISGDVLNGDLLGFGGNDIIDGGEGNDTIFGDAGHSDLTMNGSLTGVAGNDILNGGSGNDTIYADVNAGSYGVPGAYGTKGRDVLFGGPGDDILYGGGNATSLLLPNDSNIFQYNLLIDNGDDIIRNLVTSNSPGLSSAAGKFELSNATDISFWGLYEVLDFSIVGGDTYTAHISDAGVDSTISFDPLSTFMVGDTPVIPFILVNGASNSYDVVLYTDAADNMVVGGDVDVAFGLGGSNTIWGDEQIDLFSSGSDHLLIGGDGVDVLFGDTGGNLNADGGDDFLVGGPGDDILVGDAGEDLSDSETGGNDILIGGSGNDALWGDVQGNLSGTAGADTFVFDVSTSFGNDTIHDWDPSDVMEFLNVPDGNIAGLDALVNFVDNFGPGEELIFNFTNGDSITLLTQGTGGTIESFSDFVAIDPGSVSIV